jgi:ABC-type molybdate transport system permease subunit
VKSNRSKGEVLFLERRTRSPSAIYTLTQVPGGGVGALRLTVIWAAISILALPAAEFLARHISRILPHT